MLVSVTIYAPLMLPTALLPFPARYRIIRQWARFQVFMLKVLCGLDYRVEGQEHLPENAAIIMAKHQSAWETIVFQEIFPQQTWVLKRELMWIPLFGWALALLRPIAIDRNAGRRAIEQVIEQGRDRLKSGIWVVVFPEGTRVAPGSTREFQIGGAALAESSGRNVLVVAHNSGDHWPAHSLRKHPGTIVLKVCPPIETSGMGRREINRLAHATMSLAMSEIGDRQTSRLDTDSALDAMKSRLGST